MDKTSFTASRLKTEPLDIPGVGTITVRALNRFQARKVQEAKGANQDHAILRYGVVDPQFTDAEIDAWMEAAPAGEIEDVTERIAALSGIGSAAAKEAYKSPGS